MLTDSHQNSQWIYNVLFCPSNPLFIITLVSFWFPVDIKLVQQLQSISASCPATLHLTYSHILHMHCNTLSLRCNLSCVLHQIPRDPMAIFMPLLISISNTFQSLMPIPGLLATPKDKLQSFFISKMWLHFHIYIYIYSMCVCVYTINHLPVHSYIISNISLVSFLKVIFT